MMVSVNFMHQSIPAALKPPLPLEICLQRQKMLMPGLEPGEEEGGFWVQLELADALFRADAN